MGERDLQLRTGGFACVVTVNIVGSSINQVRTLSTEVRDIFDCMITFPDFENIEDCLADEPEENFTFDSSTGKQIYETAQTISFNYVK